MKPFKVPLLLTERDGQDDGDSDEGAHERVLVHLLVGGLLQLVADLLLVVRVDEGEEDDRADCEAAQDDVDHVQHHVRHDEAGLALVHAVQQEVAKGLHFCCI